MTGLRPNWSDHDAATCPIINYFADRKNTEITLRKQENLIAETWATVKNARTVPNLKLTEKNLRKKDFGHSIKMLGFGKFLILTG